jgi:hypothetical protein
MNLDGPRPDGSTDCATTRFFANFFEKHPPDGNHQFFVLDAREWARSMPLRVPGGNLKGLSQM